MSKIAMLVGPEFEDSELAVPRDRLTAAGHQVVLLGTEAGQTLHGKKGVEKVKTDAAVGDCDPADYDALIIPGGHSPDHLRTESAMVEFVRRFAGLDRPIAAVCHGPQLLIEADVVRGRLMTSWPSVRTDLRNAGAEIVDQPVAEDPPFITSRNPDDLGPFTDAILQRLAEHRVRPPMPTQGKIDAADVL